MSNAAKLKIGHIHLPGEGEFTKCGILAPHHMAKRYDKITCPKCYIQPGQFVSIAPHHLLQLLKVENTLEFRRSGSSSHVEEFGNCRGVVIGPVDYNNCKPGEPGYDVAKIGPEVNVRWLPSMLRYAYAEEDLIKLW